MAVAIIGVALALIVSSLVFSSDSAPLPAPVSLGGPPPSAVQSSEHIEVVPPPAIDLRGDNEDLRKDGETVRPVAPLAEPRQQDNHSDDKDSAPTTRRSRATDSDDDDDDGHERSSRAVKSDGDRDEPDDDRDDDDGDDKWDDDDDDDEWGDDD